MAFQDARERLEHIEDAILWLEQVTADRDLADYRRDRILRDVVERNLERISEAARHVPADLKDQQPRIPWRRIADLGNRLRHGYHAIDHDIIWGIVTLELPALKTAVQAMLRALGDDPDA